MQLTLLTRLVELHELEPANLRQLAVLLCEDSPELCGGTCSLLAGMLKNQAEAKATVGAEWGEGARGEKGWGGGRRGGMSKERGAGTHVS